MHVATARRWDVRIARARQLAAVRPVAAEILNFYAELASLQKGLASSLPPSRYALRRGSPKFAAPEMPPANEGGQPLAPAIDIYVVASVIPDVLVWLRETGPARLRAAAADLRTVDLAEWRTLLETYWATAMHEPAAANDAMLFVVESALQPFVERLAAQRRTRIDSVTERDAFRSAERPAEAGRDEGHQAPHEIGLRNSGGEREGGRDDGHEMGHTDEDEAALVETAAPARCPFCGGKPVAGVLREEGQSARRSLVCGLCFTEWVWPRIVCPSCSESRFDALAVYTTEDLPTARLDACETCRRYLTTIDLTKDGMAVPVVDEMAAVLLDLWAREQGYVKVRSNLLRL